MRNCGKCGKAGHNARTCKGVVGVSGSTTVSKTEGVGSIPTRPANPFNKKKVPHLWAATQRGLDRIINPLKEKWGRFLELRKKGEDAAADRLMRKLLGIKPKVEMTEEKKAELKRYNMEHKEEIAQRQKEKREARRMRLEAIARATGKLDKKRKK